VSAADQMTAVNALTVADALVAFALHPETNDDRIRRCIDALREFGYPSSADTLERLQHDTHSVKL
jgi:hypothetical protein